MKRRDFLAGFGGCATAGLAVWVPGLAAARVRFGYAAITWGGNDRQAIDDIAAIGVTDPAETPRESGVIARRYLEALQRWNEER